MPRAYMVIHKLSNLGRDYSVFFNALKQIGEGVGYGFESVWIVKVDDISTDDVLERLNLSLTLSPMD